VQHMHMMMSCQGFDRKAYSAVCNASPQMHARFMWPTPWAPGLSNRGQAAKWYLIEVLFPVCMGCSPNGPQ